MYFQPSPTIHGDPECEGARGSRAGAAAAPRGGDGPRGSVPRPRGLRAPLPNLHLPTTATNPASGMRLLFLNFFCLLSHSFLPALISVQKDPMLNAMSIKNHF